MNEKANIKECKRCLYKDSHPLGLTIDKEGICSGCRVHEEKDLLDWDERFEKLRKIVSPYKSKDSRNYDCIIPVTGGNDSFFTVYVAIKKLNLNPLLVTNNIYYNTALGIRNLAQLRRFFNRDILSQNINPHVVKKVAKTTLIKLGNFHWPAIAGQTVFPVKVSISHKIPLIIWGAHQGMEQVGMFSHLQEVEMTRWYRHDHDLMGIEADQLLDNFDNLKESDIWQYRYPDNHDLIKTGVRGIYLSNYIRWDPLAQHRKMVKLANYHSGRMNRTFDIYDHVHDFHYMNLHDIIKYRVHGYSKVVDQLCREIRHKRIKREHAIKMAIYYQNKDPLYKELLLEWLGINNKSMDFIIDNFAKYNFKRKSRLFNFINNHNKIINEKPNDKIEGKIGKKHITIGKGYPD